MKIGSKILLLTFMFVNCIYSIDIDTFKAAYPNLGKIVENQACNKKNLTFGEIFKFFRLGLNGYAKFCLFELYIIIKEFEHFLLNTKDQISTRDLEMIINKLSEIKNNDDIKNLNILSDVKIVQKRNRSFFTLWLVSENQQDRDLAISYLITQVIESDLENKPELLNLINKFVLQNRKQLSKYTVSRSRERIKLRVMPDYKFTSTISSDTNLSGSGPKSGPVKS